MSRELINLPTNHHFIHEQFILWNFSVQLSSVNPFGRIEADKVIETTINKDSKCPGWWKGFSTKADTVTRWVKNATHRASLKRELHEFCKSKKWKKFAQRFKLDQNRERFERCTENHGLAKRSFYTSLWRKRCCFSIKWYRCNYRH